MSMTLEYELDKMIAEGKSYEDCKKEINDFWQEPGKTKGLDMLKMKSCAGLFQLQANSNKITKSGLLINK